MSHRHICAPAIPSEGPPAQSLAYELQGQSGNEWQLRVPRSGITLRFRVTQRPQTAVLVARFDIAPIDARHPGGQVRPVAVRHAFVIGANVLQLHWDGRDNAGHRDAPGSYRVYGAATISSDHTVTCADGSSGIERIRGQEDYGLGRLIVDASRGPRDYVSFNAVGMSS